MGDLFDYFQVGITRENSYQAPMRRLGLICSIVVVALVALETKADWRTKKNKDKKWKNKEEKWKNKNKDKGLYENDGKNNYGMLEGFKNISHRIFLSTRVLCDSARLSLYF